MLRIMNGIKGSPLALLQPFCQKEWQGGVWSAPVMEDADSIKRFIFWLWSIFKILQTSLIIWNKSINAKYLLKFTFLQKKKLRGKTISNCRSLLTVPLQFKEKSLFVHSAERASGNFIQRYSNRALMSMFPRRSLFFVDPDRSSLVNYWHNQRFSQNLW